ncbi:MAG: MlaD family protein [Solirubrobacterales bacterium]
MRRLGFIFSLVATTAAIFAVSAPADDERTYLIEMYNAFGVVPGSDVRVAGVNAGSVTDLYVNSAKRAVVEVKLSGDLAVLGENTTCSTDPQSLIAEYFIDCTPDGPEIEPSGDVEDPDVPAENVQQTVQNDLVNNTLREPFKRRLQLLINEFGTALAGNPENLNEAIRLGAPALTSLEKVLDVLGDQNTIIRDLQSDSDRVISRLTERREDVVSFIEEARDTAAASAERRTDLSTDFALLDDFLAELNPVLVELEAAARESTPLFTDLRAAAPGLNELITSLPAFNEATYRSLDSLGEASLVGERALRHGKEEIQALADSGAKATAVGEMLADFLRDLDDPGRATEVDARAPGVTGRAAPTGYTGLEGLLNYGYYQTASLNQFDQVGHLLHFSLYYIFSGPCGSFTSGRDPETGETELPNKAGGVTSNPRLVGPNSNEINNCVGWLGDSQPGLTDPENSFPELPPYHPSVCPAGTEPPQAAAELCPGTPKQGKSAGASEGAGAEALRSDGGAEAPGAGPDGLLPDLPLPNGGPDIPEDLEGLLDLPRRALNDLPNRLQDRLRQVRNRGGGGGGGATNDLLDFLLGP